ncbi:MAG TPA: tRNA (guanosine(46)-N7)-methyltransferase TrmB [Candidatus Nanopelagicaceae bacterium]
MENPTIKSFKLRGTRITSAQIQARERLWGDFGIDFKPELLDLRSLFPSASQVILEIGFGMGEATIAVAKNSPDTGFIAVDVHQPGIGKLLAEIEESGVQNVRVLEEDAHLVMSFMIPDASLDGIHLFFPDPWPKTRHHKRRIINENFIALAWKKIKPGGYFHIATDWVPYTEWIQERFARSTHFVGGEVAQPSWRPLTRFEAQGLRKQHEVRDLHYVRV